MSDMAAGDEVRTLFHHELKFSQMKTGFINLERLPGSGYGRINGKACIYIPYEGSPIINRTEKGCYLNIVINENPNPDYGNAGFIAAGTHTKEDRDKLTIEERKVQVPILGNIKNVSTRVTTRRPDPLKIQDDDLPL